MSFITITDRQEMQLLIPSIINILRFSKLSKPVSHYLNSHITKVKVNRKALISLFPGSYLALTFNKQKNKIKTSERSRILGLSSKLTPFAAIVMGSYFYHAHSLSSFCSH